ncbi:hypothetical protein DSECCO2_197520 [anaerobic digester metagenome]
MTVEEKANVYLARVTPLGAPVNAAYNGYVAGYNEAMRWRDPKEELPKIGESVIVKYRTAKNVEKHGIGKYFNLGIGNPWIIEGSTSRNVIGWRPIDN